MNSSIADASASSSGRHPAEPFVYIPLSTLNAILSAFSALFFLVKDKAVHPVLRRLVVTMSVFELLFHLSVIITYATQLLHYSAQSDMETPVEMLVLYTVLRFSLTMRNWTMGLISWSRVEAVFNPVSSRSGSTAFKPAYLVAMETGAAIIGLVLSLLMVLAQDGRLTGRFGWSGGQVHAIEIVFYAYQGMVPILSILVATIITVVVLRNASQLRKRLCSPPAAPASRGSQQPLPRRIRGRYRYRAHEKSVTSANWTEHIEDRAVEHAAARAHSGPDQAACLIDDIDKVSVEPPETRQSRCRQPPVVSDKNQRAAGLSSQRQAKRERASIRLIVALSLTCLILESPTDIFGFVKNKAPLTELVVNILVELDSLCNFFIYTCTTSILRQFCRRGGTPGTGVCTYRKATRSSPGSNPHLTLTGGGCATFHHTNVSPQAARDSSSSGKFHGSPRQNPT